MPSPDCELWDYLKRYQSGDEDAGWLFVEHAKIRAIIRGRVKVFRGQFHWLPSEDFEDVELGVIPRLLDIAKGFDLPNTPNDGRIISYFALRIRGECDFLLKKITDMKQVVNPETKKVYLKSLAQPIDGLEETMPAAVEVDREVVEQIEHGRQRNILQEMVNEIPEDSNDHIWFRCYQLRLHGCRWSDVAQNVGYKPADYAWLKDNVLRFVTRLKDRLIRMGEDISYRICGIYSDDSEVAMAVYDSANRANNVIWSKGYETYADLEKIEAKLGDIFRQHEITYVVLNDQEYDSRSTVIIMRYLAKREAYVESVDLRPFAAMAPRMPDSVSGVASNDSHRNALILTHIKRAHLNYVARNNGTPGSHHPASD